MSSQAYSASGHHDFAAARLRLARLRVAGAASLGDVFRRATEEAARTLEVERVGIWLFVDDRSALRCFHLCERARGQHSEGAILRAHDFPAYVRALEDRRTIGVEHAREDPLTRELREAYLEPLGIVSMLDAPLFRDGRVIGVVCHEHVGAPRAFSDAERDFASAMADSVALQFEASARQDAEAAVTAHEVHLAEQHKMEALGRLATSVAHDFRNLLTVVIGFAHEIRRDGSATPRIQAAAREIEEVGERGAVLAKELISFGRGEPHATRVVDVAEAIAAMASVLRTAVGSIHQVEIRRAAPTGRVFIDRSQLERMVLNLAINARDAMPRGGTVRIETGDAYVTAGDGPPGVYVVIEVADTGIGMDAGTRARIFEPFFTTKPPGQGSGIGLATVYRIVERAGGFVHVESEPERGTRMRVYLPRVAAEP